MSAKVELRVYYAQNDDAPLVEKTSKGDLGLGLPKTAWLMLCQQARYTYTCAT